MNIGAAFVADGKAAEAADPGERSLNDPAVTSQVPAILDTAPGDAGDDVAVTAFAPAALVIIRLVGVQLVRPSAWSPAWPLERWHCVEHRLHHHGVVAVRPGQADGERNAIAISDDVTFGARPTTIGRVRPGLLASLFAGMLALSTAARSQLMALA